MAYVTVSQARAAAQRVKARTQKTDAQILREQKDTKQAHFDIFLSHSSMDKELVLGAKQLIEDKGLSVYVDWIEDGDLDRQAVDKARAALLRERMKQCDAMFYAHTLNASTSRWCPWELGFFDGLSSPAQQVFVLLIVSDGEQYRGQEYLALYEIVELDKYKHIRKVSTGSSDLAQRLLRDRFGIRNPLSGGPFA